MKLQQTIKTFIHFSLVIYMGIILSGCAATEWQPHTVKMAEISWPPQPNEKIRYAGEIRSFEQTSSSLGTLFTGKSQSGVILRPVDIATGPGGIMAIADQDRKGVHFYVPASKKYKFLILAGREKIETPVGVTFDDAGNLYVTDSKRGKILIYNNQGHFLHAISQAGGLPLKRPSGITFNPHDGRIYVSDTTAHNILVFSRLGQFITRMGKRGETTASLNFPTHIGSDSRGKIYVTDSMNFRAQVLDPGNDKWTSFGKQGNGSGNFASPKGIGADKNGNIYVAETLFDNVQIFSSKGTYLLSIGSQGGGPGQFWMPSGLFINDDRLYVCDTYNGRIQLFDLLTDSPRQKAQRGESR